MVVEAEVKEEQGRPLFGVNGVVFSKKDLTGPTLLEMSGLATYQELISAAGNLLCPGQWKRTMSKTEVQFRIPN